MYDEYRAKVLEVHDGDTFTLLIDCGFYSWTQQRIRLLGIDCPELSKTGGPEALAFTQDWFARYAIPFVLLKPERAESGVLIQSFARFVGDIHSLGGKSLADDLRSAGHVKVKGA